ncbi:MAG: glycoside hydrolase [Truepera sp.]|nr:glycoside hydrolase [Truepera sp.]
MDNLKERCRDTLRANDRGGYTVPTAGLYPFQWLWDSGFNALGWATFDEVRAWLELTTLLEAQWEDGMVPHIVFHDRNTGYPLDHTFWDAPGPVPSSGITQPPVIATVARRMLERTRDRKQALAAVRTLYPGLLAFHRWFYRARDPEGTGLVTVLHPWEGGMDNSPVWDEALARVTPVAMTVERRDTHHVGAEQRPHQAEYQRYLALVLAFRERRYDPARLYRESPFKVASVAINAVLHRANQDLLALAQVLEAPDAPEIEAWLTRGQQGMASLWHDDLFYSRDLVSGHMIPVRTWEAFMPLYSGQATPEQAARLEGTMRRWSEAVRYLLPSTAPDDVCFEPRRYWRGPVWMPVNWLLAQGCHAYGFMDLAVRLKQDMGTLAERSGLYEYYDPLTGDGLGGGTFSWTAALLLDWMT